MKKESHIKNFRHIVLIWFLLFSLSPCTVKEVLFHSANTDYAKPLNKSKTTVRTSCSYSSTLNLQVSAVKKSEISKQFEPVIFFDNPFFSILSAKVYNNYLKTSSSNSPPKYILFKRLKIDLAKVYTYRLSFFHV